MKRMKVLMPFHKGITPMTRSMTSYDAVCQPNIKNIIQTSGINKRHFCYCEGHSSRAVDQDKERREHQVSLALSQVVRTLSQVVRTLLQVVRTLSQVVRAMSQVVRALSQVVRVRV